MNRIHKVDCIECLNLTRDNYGWTCKLLKRNISYNVLWDQYGIPKDCPSYEKLLDSCGYTKEEIIIILENK